MKEGRKRKPYERHKKTDRERRITVEMQKASINKILVQQLQGVTFIEYENVKKPIKTT